MAKRKNNKRKKGGKSLLTRILCWTSGLLVVLLLALGGTALYFINFALTPIANNPRCNADSCLAYLSTFEGVAEDPLITPMEGKDTLLRDTVIVDAEGYHLKAFYARAERPTRKTALLIHGYNDSHWRMLQLGHMYYRTLGYNIIVPDQFAHGESEGDHIRMGWLDRLAMKQWLDVAADLFGEDLCIVVHGVSMGGATTMMLSGEADLPASVKCFVDDCGYTSVDDQFTYILRRDFGLPRWPIIPVTSLVNKWKNGWSFTEASSIEQVKRCQRPMLFIHGEMDDYVPTEMVYRLYDAHPGEKALWIAPGSAHANSFKDHPAEYTQQVKAFAEKYME